jgi:hypothetical protein
MISRYHATHLTTACSITSYLTQLICYTLLQILVDIIIRELTNIPLVPPPAENEGDLDDASVLGEHTGNEDSDIPACSLEEQTRQMYYAIL